MPVMMRKAEAWPLQLSPSVWYKVKRSDLLTVYYAVTS